MPPNIRGKRCCLPPGVTREWFLGLRSYLWWSKFSTVKFILAVMMPVEKSFVSFCKGVLSRGKNYLWSPNWKRSRTLGQSCSLLTCFPGLCWCVEHPTTAHRLPLLCGNASASSEEQEAAAVYNLNYKPFPLFRWGRSSSVMLGQGQCPLMSSMTALLALWLRPTLPRWRSCFWMNNPCWSTEPSCRRMCALHANGLRSTSISHWFGLIGLLKSNILSS